MRALYHSVLGLGIVLVVCVVGFRLRSERFEQLATELEQASGGAAYLPVTIFDTQSLGYDEREAGAILASLRRPGIGELYTWTQLTLDVLFPLAYGLALYRAARLVRRRGARQVLQRMAWLAPACDLGENLCSAVLVNIASAPPWLVGLGSAFTLLKSLLLAASLLGLLWASRWLCRIYVTRASLVGLAGVWFVLPLWTEAPLTIRNLAILEGKWEQFWAFSLAPIVAHVMLTQFQLGWANALERLSHQAIGSVARGTAGLHPVRWWQRARRFWYGLSPNAQMLLRGALVALLVVPLGLWCAERNDLDLTPCALGFALGVTLAVITRWYAMLFSGVAGLARRMDGTIQRYTTDPAWDALLVRIRRTPGYHNPADHANALLIVVLFGGISYWLYRSTGPCGAPFPTLGYVLILAGMLTSAISGLSFFLDRHRVPTTLVVALIVVFWNGMSPRAHQFGVDAWKAAALLPPRATRERCEEPRAPAELSAPTAASGAALKAASELAASERVGPMVHLLERLRRGAASGTAGTLVVLSASGGGIQAASWTTLALAQLERRFGRRFSDSVFLASGASGGSVGIYFWLEALRASLAVPDAGAARDWAVRAHCAARASSLQATAWGLAFPDTLFLLSKDWRDRAWAMEESWLANLDRAFADLPTEGGGRAVVRRTRMSELAAGAALGELPGFVFNATVVDTGELLGLSNLGWNEVNDDMFGSKEAGAAKTVSSSESSGASQPRATFLPLEVVYPAPPGGGSWDLEVVSAARLSATFPYITPVSTPRADPAFEPGAQRHVIDGGLFDNQGVVAGVQYLNYLLRNPETLDVLRNDIDRVLFLRLEAYPESELSAADAGGAIYQLIAPPKTLMRARSTTQERRSDMELRLLGDYLRARAPELRLSELTLRPRPLTRKQKAPPTSWQLDTCSIQRLMRDWDASYEHHRAEFQAAFGGELEPAFGAELELPGATVSTGATGAGVVCSGERLPVCRDSE